MTITSRGSVGSCQCCTCCRSSVQQDKGQGRATLWVPKPLPGHSKAAHRSAVCSWVMRLDLGAEMHNTLLGGRVHTLAHATRKRVRVSVTWQRKLPGALDAGSALPLSCPSTTSNTPPDGIARVGDCTGNARWAGDVPAGLTPSTLAALVAPPWGCTSAAAAPAQHHSRAPAPPPAPATAAIPPPRSVTLRGPAALAVLLARPSVPLGTLRPLCWPARTSAPGIVHGRWPQQHERNRP